SHRKPRAADRPYHPYGQPGLAVAWPFPARPRARHAWHGPAVRRGRAMTTGGGMTPDTMKAVLLTRHGDLDALVYREDVPVPHPAAGEVLIEVTACGMNNTDVWVRQGAYGSET